MKNGINYGWGTEISILVSEDIDYVTVCYIYNIFKDICYNMIVLHFKFYFMDFNRLSLIFFVLTMAVYILLDKTKI